MIASLAIGGLLAAVGVALLALQPVWDWAGDRIRLRANDLWPPEDRERLLAGYLKSLVAWRRFAPAMFILLGLAALLLGEAGFAAFIGGVALLLVGASLQLFHRFLPRLPVLLGSAVLFAGGGIGVAIGFDASLAFSVVVGAAFGAAMLASWVGVELMAQLAVRRMSTTDGLAGEAARANRGVLLLACVLALAVTLAPAVGLVLAIGVPWPFIAAWLAGTICTCAGAAWLGVRAARRWRA